MTDDSMPNGTHEDARAASSAPDDIARLRERFPEWTFGVVWTTVASGPDHRRIWAMRDAAVVSGRNEQSVAAAIATEEW